MTPAFSAALASLSPRQKGRGFVARCPAHDDTQPSLNVDEADGKTLLKCQAGCDTRDVVAALGLAMTDLFDPEPEPVGEPRIVATYDYTDESGQLLYQAVRYDPKGFKQRRPLPDGRWDWDLTGVDRVPYRLPELLTSTEIVVAEGEKDVETLVALGYVATCNAGGAGNWRPEWGPLFEGKRVTIIPDNDDAGRKHAESVRASVAPFAHRTTIVDLPGAPHKGDVSAWLAMGHTADELQALLDDRGRLRYERMSDIEVTEDQPLAVPPFVLDEGPCILFGDGGSGKSTLALVLAASFATGHELIPGSVPNIKGPVMWLDYEAQRHTTAKRLAMLGHADAPIFYVPGLRPIAEDVDRLSAIADYEGIELVVVDSVVLAVGGAVSPKDAEAPTQYANAVAAIAPRSIGLAHVVKSTEDDGRKPFGSGFWHNIARLTWHVKRDENEGGHCVRLTCRKRTNGEAFSPQTLWFDWADGLLVRQGEPANSWKARIIEYIRAEGPASASDIGARLGTSRQHIHDECGRHRDLFTLVPGTPVSKWGLVDG